MTEQRRTNIVLRILDCVDLSIAPMIMVIIFVVVLLQILSRILPGNALPWTVEVGEILLGFMVWFGISVAARNNNHIAFDLMVRRFRPVPKKVVRFCEVPEPNATAQTTAFATRRLKRALASQ